MLFPIFSKIDLDIKSSLPGSTNAQESMHSVFYQISDTKNSIPVGFTYLILFADYLKNLFDEICLGASINYGIPERWKLPKSIESKKMKYPQKNDGRPPDTTKELLKNNSKVKKGRPLGSINKENNPLITYQSYKHFENTCYITSLIESLFVISETINLIFPKNSILYKLFAHFDTRTDREFSNSGCISSCLTSGHKLVIKYILEEKKLYTRCQYGSPCEVLHFLVHDSKSNHFDIVMNKTFECENGHKKEYKKQSTQQQITLDNNLLSKLSSESETYDLQNYIGKYFSDGFYVKTDTLCSLTTCKRPCYKQFTIDKINEVLVFEMKCSEENHIAKNKDSNKFYFPPILFISGSPYILKSKLLSTSESGEHFYSINYRKTPTEGVYIYNDLINGGIAVLQPNDLKFVGRSELCTMVFYVKEI